VPAKRRSALIKPSVLLELASHAVMGAAVGLGFAFLETHLTALGVATLISYSRAPDAVRLIFVGTCAAGFGIGATLTGAALTLTENSDGNPTSQTNAVDNAARAENTSHEQVEARADAEGRNSLMLRPTA
jgi:hypothetical protein